MDPRRAEPWRRRLARWLAKAWPHLLAGVAVSLFMAWGLPMLLAVRGVGPSGAPMSLWHRGPSSELWSDHAPSLSVRRSAFSDWYIAEPVTTALDPRTGASYRVFYGEDVGADVPEEREFDSKVVLPMMRKMAKKARSHLKV